MKNTYAIIVKSPTGKAFSFTQKVAPEVADSWRQEGFEVNEVVNIFPYWLPSLLIRPWCLVQDFWNAVRLF